MLVELKSSEHIQGKNGLSQSLEGSEYIVLLNGFEKDLRMITGEYASNCELRDIFGITMSLKEKNELMIIKEILIKKGLRV